LAVGEGQTQTHLALTFKFIERALFINSSSEHMLDGVVIMKVLIAMIENLSNYKEPQSYLLTLII